MKESFPLIKQNCMQIHSFGQLTNYGTHYLKLYKQILQLACWKNIYQLYIIILVLERNKLSTVDSDLLLAI